MLLSLHRRSKQQEIKMTQYKIVKTSVGTNNGGERTAWNVVDIKDEFVIDTFSLKRDAKEWVAKSLTK